MSYPSLLEAREQDQWYYYVSPKNYVRSSGRLEKAI